nr:hypothetical protein [Tanacetum cinerariifolium]
QNIDFVSSSNTDRTTESVSAAFSISVVNAKLHVSSLENVDSLSNAVIYSFFASQSSSPQLDNDDLKQINADDLEEINIGTNGPTSLGFDMSKVDCYNCHMKGHFAKEFRSPKDSRRNSDAEPQRRNVPVETSTSNALVSQCDGVGSYDWKARLLVYKQNESVFEEDIKLLKLEVQLRDNALINLRQTLEKAEQERDDLKLKNIHATQPDLVFNNAPNGVETDHSAFTVKLSSTKPDQDLSCTYRPSTPIIEDWVSDSEDESKTKTPQIVPSFV